MNSKAWFVLVVISTTLVVGLGTSLESQTRPAPSTTSQSGTFATSSFESTLASTSSYESLPTSTSNCSGFADTYFQYPNSIAISAGGFGFRIVSDSTNASVAGATICVMDTLGINNVFQVVQISSFSQEQDGWLVPSFPLQAVWGGELNFTVSYQGATYYFTAGIPPIGTDCVTLHVPSGNVTRSTVMNGIGSYCYQGG